MEIIGINTRSGQITNDEIMIIPRLPKGYYYLFDSHPFSGGIRQDHPKDPRLLAKDQAKSEHPPSAEKNNSQQPQPEDRKGRLQLFFPG